MFVLKKTFDAMQLAWSNEVKQNLMLKRKIDNLTSEFNVTYDNLANLEKELNALKGYITFLKMQHNVMSYEDFIKTQNSTNSIVPKKVKPTLTPASDVHNYKLHPGVSAIEKDTSLLVSYDGDMDYNRTKYEKLNNQLNEIEEHIKTKCSNGEVYTSYYDDSRNTHNVESSSYSYSNDSSSYSDSSSSSSSSCSSSCD